jgi:glutamate synthase domain-containing protein 3
MTGGRIVILGSTGRNFAAGMSGGIAYVLDLDPARCNTELVGFEEIGEADAIELHELVEEHHLRTLSPVAARVLEDWDAWLPRFVKVMPHDYKRALGDMAKAEQAMRADAEQDNVADVVGAPQTGTSRQS